MTSPREAAVMSVCIQYALSFGSARGSVEITGSVEPFKMDRGTKDAVLRESRESPLVTVLMAVHNGERYLKEAIDSILNQTWRDFEFLIVDDGSTDMTPDILASYRDSRIRVLRNRVNRGLARSLNRGLREARGELIARQDADDISFSNRLEVQVAHFRKNPDLVLLGCQALIIDEEGKEVPNSRWLHPRSYNAIRWALMFDNPLFHTSVMFRRQVVGDSLGGYDESFQRSQDYDLWSRVAYRWRVENLSQRLVANRVRHDSLMRRDGRLNALYSQRIIDRNLRTILRDDEIPEDWGALLQHLRLDAWEDASSADLTRLMEMIRWVFARYCELYPGARRDRDVRRHLALQFVRLAGFSKKRNTRTRWNAHVRAAVLSPVIVLTRAHASFSIRARRWRSVLR